MKKHTGPEMMIQRTIDSNIQYAMSSKSQADLMKILSPAVKLCLEFNEDQSKERTETLRKYLTEVSTVLERESPLVSWMLLLLSEASKKQNNLAEAEKYALESLSIRETVYGSESHEVCLCIDFLSHLMMDAKDYASSSKFFLHAAAIKFRQRYSLLRGVVDDAVTFCEALKEAKQPDIALKVMQGMKDLCKEPQPKDSTQEDEPRDPILVRIITQLIALHREQSMPAEQVAMYEELIQVYKNSSHPFDVDDLITAYEDVLLLYSGLQRYQSTGRHIDAIVALVVKHTGLRSTRSMGVFRLAGAIMLQQAHRDSPTRLCDRIDGLRYYLCALVIQKELGLRDKIDDTRGILENEIFNNRPLSKIDVSTIVSKVYTQSSIDFLLEPERSQNVLLKVVYPPFMAEDALCEKPLTIPSKAGFLAKYDLMKSWKTRHFVLDRDVLYYFDVQTDQKPQGEYSLLDFKTIDILPPEKKYKPHTYCFQLTGPKRSIILAAETEDLMKDWVATISKART